MDIFAWSYRDIPGLDTDIMVHTLPLKEGCSLIRQKLKRTRPNMSSKTREEFLKQFDAGFLAVADYPPWIANIVPAPNFGWKSTHVCRLSRSGKIKSQRRFPVTPHRCFGE